MNRRFLIRWGIGFGCGIVLAAAISYIVFIMKAPNDRLAFNIANANNTNDAAQVETYWLSYLPTQCNTEPWAGYASDQRLTKIQRMVAYYEAEYGVIVLDSELTTFGADAVFCAACGCPKGQIYRVNVSAADRLTLLNVGFTEEDALKNVGVQINNENTNADAAIPDEVQRLYDRAVPNVDPNVDPNVNQNIDSNVEAVNTNTNPVENDSSAESDQPAESKTDTKQTGTTTSTSDTPEPTERDKELKSMAENIQTKLAEYFSERGSYPETLADLSLPDADFTGITYTPIGTVPANYYDLSVEYSTGKVLLNP